MTFEGIWKIIIQSKNAGWSQRVQASNTKSGTVVIPGNPGQSSVVVGDDKKPWQLKIQHNDGTHGWEDSWLRESSSSISSTSSVISKVIDSEDITTPNSDRDFNDLIIRLEKVGMIDQPSRPFSILPRNMQMMPDGIFETSLGRYFMGVKIRNIWTIPWIPNSTIGLTNRCKQWLQNAGIVVIESWSDADLAVVGQKVANNRVLLESPLQPWETRMVYFKVDVSQAQVRKHNIEVDILSPSVDDPEHPNRKASSQILVSQTTFDPEKNTFVSATDHGKLVAKMGELVVEKNSFIRAVTNARKKFGRSGGFDGENFSQKNCDPAQLEEARRKLLRFLKGEKVDLCSALKDLQNCCNTCDDDKPDPNEDWHGSGNTGMEFFSFPTVIDYSVNYNQPFPDKFGPIPYDDPWWKVVLAIIAIILTIAAIVSATSDLANRSDDVVIGQLTRSVLNPFDSEEDAENFLDNNEGNLAQGSVDAAVVRLNGNRGLTTSIFSYLDAASNEDNTTPISSLNGRINTPGNFLTNVELDQIFENLRIDPNNPAFQNAARVFKSGARTGLTHALMTGITPIAPRRREDGGLDFFVNQIDLEVADEADPQTVSNSGDSGSLWIQRDTNAIVALNHAGCTRFDATASRIEDVVNALGIRFA